MSPAKRLWPLLAVCAVGAGAGLTANASASSAAAGATVKIRANDDWDTLDPAKTNGTNLAFQMDHLLYDDLVYINPQGKLEPQLATKWTSTPTKTVLHIRKGARCDDGTPVTPTVVANSLNYLAAKSTAAPYEARTFGVGKAHTTANNRAGTVTIKLSKPWGNTVLGLAMPWAGIICPKALANPASMKQTGGGSGPYVLTSSQRGSQYTMTLHKGYNWGPDGWSTNTAGIPHTIIEEVIENTSTAANAFLTGQVNVAPVIGADESRVASTGGLFHTSNEDVGGSGVEFNEGRFPGNDPKMREALGLLIDPSKFMDAWTNGQGQALSSLVTPNMPCYLKQYGKPVPANVAKAKRIFASQGWKPGAGGKLMKNGKPLTVRIAGWNVMNAAPEYMLNALTSAGVSATLATSDTDTWVTTLYTKRNYDMSVYQWQSTFPSPIIISGQDQDLGIKSPAEYAAADRAATLPPAKACPVWHKAISDELNGFHVRPVGASITNWFGKGWKFSTAWNFVDPFSLRAMS